MPHFTIITVCLNIVSTIERTLKSIANQTFQDFQWIVVDGASTDGTLDILKKYSNRIDILISEPDKGIYNAMNKGIKLATGKYINFMNGGDEFYDYSVLEKVFNSNMSADVVYGDTYYVDKNEFYLCNSNLNKYTFYQWSINHQSSFVKSIVQQKYPFNEIYKICADYDFFVKILFKHAEFYHVSINISKFYSGGFGEINHLYALQEMNLIRNVYFNFFDKLKYDAKTREKINFYKMVITHPRYIAGWIKNKLIHKI